MIGRESVPLSPDHDVASFACGEESLDGYLRNEAQKAQASGWARTHVWVADDDPKSVVGYYTLVPTVIMKGRLPAKMSEKGTKNTPGVLIAKLALHTDLRGKHLGADLLVDALTTVVAAADLIGGRVIYVEALEDNKVFEFYKQAAFIGIDGSYDLWMQMDTARAALA